MVSPDTPKPEPMSSMELLDIFHATARSFLESRKTPEGHSIDNLLIVIGALETQKQNILKNLFTDTGTEKNIF